MRLLLNILLLGIIFLVSENGNAQRKSPPATAEGKIGKTEITINYSQPSARGREIMDGLVPFGEVWRTGANEATTFEISNDITIEGKKLEAGKYSLYTIPGEDSWTIILNEVWDQWGTQYNKSRDVLRVEAEPEETDEFVETFKISVEDDAVVLEWENTRVPIEIKG